MTAMELGHDYLVLTDHSPRLTVANGLSPERLRRVRAEGYATTGEEMSLGACSVAVPVLSDPELRELVDRQLAEAGVGARHELVAVEAPDAAKLLAAWDLEVTSMGRGPDQDPLFFAAAAAAGTLAGRLAAAGR